MTAPSLSTTSAKRRMEIGLFLSAGEFADGVCIVSWADLVAVALRAEALGVDSVWVGDHLRIGLRPESDDFGMWECWSLLSALAAATDRIEIGTLVASTPYRSPSLLAKMAETVDEISGGRLILGVGAGWHEPEFKAFGFPYDHWASRFEEAVQIITGLLRGETVTFDGTYYQIEDCELRPRGPRPNGPRS